MIETRFFSLEQAAPHYGYRTANALRMAFTRGTFPERFLRRLGKRKVLVDRHALDQWILHRQMGGEQLELFK